MIKEIDGNLITMANKGIFDVISHGCNCFCKMKSGIAPQMHKAFGCASFEKEDMKYVGDINKLGTIDYQFIPIENSLKSVVVVNSYTQYMYGTDKINVDYDAITLCFRKMNIIFRSKHIGLPKIGSGKARGDWNKIYQIIKNEFTDCDVTIVNYVG